MTTIYKNSFALRNCSPVKGPRLGPFSFGATGAQVQRKRIALVAEKEAMTNPQPVPFLFMAHQMFLERGKDIMISFPRVLCPTEISSWFRLAGRQEDWEKNTDEIVVCSSLRVENEWGNGCFARIDRPGNTDADRLFNDSFLRYGHFTLFLNIFPNEDSRSLGEVHVPLILFNILHQMMADQICADLTNPSISSLRYQLGSYQKLSKDLPFSEESLQVLSWEAEIRAILDEIGASPALH
ncbi:MAG: hypothetical protein ABIJ26_05155 [Candidatus Margulisiibacteriota bacterium]